MARKTKSSNIRSRSGSSQTEDDTKFYIKFKDPRSKSQIFYYFDEEDIFDPCIPLNHGDIVNDSAEVPIETKKNPPPKVADSKRAPAPAITKNKGVELPYFEDSTLQVQTANILPPKKPNTSKSIPLEDFEEDLEGAGYMTAMDMKYVAEEDLQEKEEFEEEIQEEEEIHELEEIKEPVKKPNRNILQLRTAVETVGDSNDTAVLEAIPLTKEEFDKNAGPKEPIEYKQWVDLHLTKNSMPARQISATEFRLLKKLIGLKTK